MSNQTEMERYMRLALEEATLAFDAGEVPVGAVLVCGNEIIARAHNRVEREHDATRHAELLCLQEAMAQRGSRLSDCTLYVTLEPCAMCAGAISHARIGRVVFGAEDPKGGAVVHGPRFFEQPTCHWRPQVTGGVLAEESAELLRDFFRARRKKKG